MVFPESITPLKVCWPRVAVQVGFAIRSSPVATLVKVPLAMRTFVGVTIFQGMLYGPLHLFLATSLNVAPWF